VLERLQRLTPGHPRRSGSASQASQTCRTGTGQRRLARGLFSSTVDPANLVRAATAEAVGRARG